MELGRNNAQVIKRYEELVNEHLKEPVNGLFDDVTTSVLIKTLVSDESESDMEVNVVRVVGVLENYFFYLLVSCKQL